MENVEEENEKMKQGFWQRVHLRKPKLLFTRAVSFAGESGGVWSNGSYFTVGFEFAEDVSTFGVLMFTLCLMHVEWSMNSQKIFFFPAHKRVE